MMLATEARLVGMGLNRNILECKFIHHIQTGGCTGVLIETYWNVNSISPESRR